MQCQNGFRKGHSCQLAITELISKIIKNLEQNKQTISLFLDLSKAYYTLTHFLTKIRAIWNKRRE